MGQNELGSLFPIANKTFENVSYRSQQIVCDILKAYCNATTEILKKNFK